MGFEVKGLLVLLALVLVSGIAFADLVAPNVVIASKDTNSFTFFITNPSNESKRVKISFLNPLEYSISPSKSTIPGASLNEYTITLYPEKKFQEQDYVGKLIAIVGEERFEKTIKIELRKLPEEKKEEEEIDFSKAASGAEALAGAPFLLFPTGFVLIPDSNASQMEFPQIDTNFPSIEFPSIAANFPELEFPVIEVPSFPEIVIPETTGQDIFGAQFFLLGFPMQGIQIDLPNLLDEEIGRIELMFDTLLVFAIAVLFIAFVSRLKNRLEAKE